jgi:hypothetical protein
LKIVILLTLFLFVIPTTFLAQDNWNESEFITMNHTERYEFVHKYQFWKIKDIKITSDLLKDMLAVSNTKEDKQTALALKSYIYLLTSHYNYKTPINLTQEKLKEDIVKQGVKLNKQKQVETIIKNHLRLEKKMGFKSRFNNYKPLIVYRLFSMFYEGDDTNTEDKRFGRVVKKIKDSVKRLDGAKQFAKRQRDIEVDIYAEDLRKMEKENELQATIRNVIISILLIIIILIGYKYIYLKRKNTKKEEQLNITTKKLSSITNQYKKTSDLIDNLEIKKDVSSDEVKLILDIEKLKTSTILSKEDWVTFKKEFGKIYPNYITALQKKYTKLTPAELRILVLEKLDLSIAEIAKMQGVNKNTIYQTKNRFTKKNSSV